MQGKREARISLKSCRSKGVYKMQVKNTHNRGLQITVLSNLQIMEV